MISPFSALLEVQIAQRKSHDSSKGADKANEDGSGHSDEAVPDVKVVPDPLGGRHLAPILQGENALHIPQLGPDEAVQCPAHLRAPGTVTKWTQVSRGG